MKEIELYYGLLCPYCKPARSLIKKIMDENPGKLSFKQTLISSPTGLINRYKLGIHSVPTILIDGIIVLRGLPEKEELIKELDLL